MRSSYTALIPDNATCCSAYGCQPKSPWRALQHPTWGEGAWHLASHTCEHQPRQLWMPAQCSDLCVMASQQRQAAVSLCVPHPCRVVAAAEQQVRQQRGPHHREGALCMAMQGVHQTVITLDVQIPPAWRRTCTSSFKKAAAVVATHAWRLHFVCIQDSSLQFYVGWTQRKQHAQVLMISLVRQPAWPLTHTQCLPRWLLPGGSHPLPMRSLRQRWSVKEP